MDNECGGQQSSCHSSPSGFITAQAARKYNLTIYDPQTLLVAMYGEGKPRGVNVLNCWSHLRAKSVSLAEVTMDGVCIVLPPICQSVPQL